MAKKFLGIAKYSISPNGKLGDGTWTNNFEHYQFKPEWLITPVQTGGLSGIYNSIWDELETRHTARLDVQEHKGVLLFSWKEGLDNIETFQGLGLIQGDSVVVSYHPVV